MCRTWYLSVHCIFWYIVHKKNYTWILHGYQWWVDAMFTTIYQHYDFKGGVFVYINMLGLIACFFATCITTHMMTVWCTSLAETFLSKVRLGACVGVSNLRPWPKGLDCKAGRVLTKILVLPHIDRLKQLASTSIVLHQPCIVAISLFVDLNAQCKIVAIEVSPGNFRIWTVQKEETVNLAVPLLATFEASEVSTKFIQIPSLPSLPKSPVQVPSWRPQNVPGQRCWSPWTATRMAA